MEIGHHSSSENPIPLTKVKPTCSCSSCSCQSTCQCKIDVSTNQTPQKFVSARSCPIGESGHLFLIGIGYHICFNHIVMSQYIQTLLASGLEPLPSDHEYTALMTE